MNASQSRFLKSGLILDGTVGPVIPGGAGVGLVLD
jgi:hypothetical protein